MVWLVYCYSISTQTTRIIVNIIKQLRTWFSSNTHLPYTVPLVQGWKLPTVVSSQVVNKNPFTNVDQFSPQRGYVNYIYHNVCREIIYPFQKFQISMAKNRWRLGMDT